MKALKTISLCVLAVQIVSGEVPRKPEDLGAHRARVSDRAEVEMLVDLLRGIADGERVEGIARKHVAPAFDTRSLLVPARADVTSTASELTIEGATATAVSATGRMQFQKTDGQWMLTSLEGNAGANVQAVTRSASEGPSVGRTFIQVPVSGEHGIDRLSKGITRSMLDRALLSAGGQTASYYAISYLSAAPFVRSTYLQFIVDREWNRILYGNMNHWIKAHTGVSGPASLAVGADGRLYVSESAGQKVSVLRIEGEESATTLVPLFSIGGLSEPTDVALNDGGTPLAPGDDVLYVLEQGENKIVKFSVGTTGATLVATFDGFDNPSALATGRWNGATNDLLYVVDKTGKHLQLFRDDGTVLTKIAELNGTVRQYFGNIETDHFGNVYLVESTVGQVLKYTSDLKYLDSDSGNDTFDAPGALDVPFGRITIEGEGTYWAGFDQLFALERWTESTGAQRRMLGLALKDIRFLPDANMSTLSSSFLLTDFGDVAIRVYDAEDLLVRTVYSGWMTSGRKTIPWDRRNMDGALVAPGTYRVEIEGSSPYREEATVSLTEFYLPLYYWQNCGSNIAPDDAMLVQGSAVQWGSAPSQTASEHATSVQYRFTGLNPESEYQIAAEYAAADGQQRLQDLSASGIPLHSPVAVSSTPHETGFLTVPKESYANGELLVSVNRRGEGTAVISQLWVKETGAGFEPHQLDGTLPTTFALEQNYPNPFNPSTVIRYALPVDARVSLTVYDITGREIATLVNEHKQAGSYEVSFDSRSGSMASGVYFYRVQAGTFSETKKMILLK